MGALSYITEPGKVEVRKSWALQDLTCALCLTHAQVGQHVPWDSEVHGNACLPARWHNANALAEWASYGHAHAGSCP